MTWRIITGDCVEAMRDLEESSIDAVVTDPPYLLGFMGKEWDQPGAFVERGDFGFGGKAAPHGGDSGGASRFFYTAKTSRAERELGRMYGAEDGNKHPTVKPVDLMQWLVRLVTPPGGVVLDPFTGSGSTGMAALREGFSFLGIEREPDYVEIARARILGDAPLFNAGIEEP